MLSDVNTGLKGFIKPYLQFRVQIFDLEDVQILRVWSRVHRGESGRRQVTRGAREKGNT